MKASSERGGSEEMDCRQGCPFWQTLLLIGAFVVIMVVIIGVILGPLIAGPEVFEIFSCP